MTRQLPTTALAFLGLLAACGSDGGTDGPVSTPDLAINPLADLATPPDLAWPRPPGYPAPPYGFAAGAVVPDLVFHGYWSPTLTTGLATSQPFGDVSLDQARTSGHRYMMIMFAGFT